MDAAYDALHTINIAFSQLIRGQITKEAYDQIIRDPKKYSAQLAATENARQNASSKVDTPTSKAGAESTQITEDDAVSVGEHSDDTAHSRFDEIAKEIYSNMWSG